MKSLNPSSIDITYIMAARNAAAYIDESIRSLLEQDGPPVAIIVVDDGSTDETREVVRRFGERVVLVANDGELHGSALARNIALQRVRSDWVAVQDADDVALPGRTNAYRAAIAEAPDIDLWYGSVAFIDERGEATVDALGRRVLEARPFDLMQLLKGNFIAHPSVCYRCLHRGQALRYDERFASMEDWVFYLNLAFRGGRFGWIDEVLTSYRLREGSLSTTAEMFRQIGRVQQFKLRNFSRWHGVAWRHRIPLAMRFLAVSLRRALSGDDREDAGRK